MGTLLPTTYTPSEILLLMPCSTFSNWLATIGSFGLHGFFNRIPIKSEEVVHPAYERHQIKVLTLSTSKNSLQMVPSRERAIPSMHAIFLCFCVILIHVRP